MENGKWRMKRVLLFIVFGCSLQFGFAQLPSLKTAVDKRQILIGQQLKYNVQATFPLNAYRVTWFDVPDSFNHFEVVIRGKIDTIEKNGMTTYRQTLLLTSFDSGINVLPSLPVSFGSLATDSTLNLLTDSIPINVAFSPLDSTKTFHDIKTIIEVKEEIPWLLIAGGIALLILLIVGVIYLIRYLRKKKKEQPLFNSKLSPYEEAMQSIEQLQKDQLLLKGEVKQFHIRSMDIFKRYLSRKMQKNMLTLTSSDILLLLNETLLSRGDTSLIAGSLRMADAVKFAKFYPHKEESEASLINTKKVIEQVDKLIFTDEHPDTK